MLKIFYGKNFGSYDQKIRFQDSNNIDNNFDIVLDQMEMNVFPCANFDRDHVEALHEYLTELLAIKE